MLVGFFGAIAWIATIDTDSNAERNNNEVLSQSDKEIANTTKEIKIIYAVSTLLSGLGVGSLLFSVGAIQGLLEEHVKRGNSE